MSYLIKINIENEIKNLYNEILLREPDKTGLYYFMSQIESNKMTLDDVKSILYDSGEAKSIRNYSLWNEAFYRELSRGGEILGWQFPGKHFDCGNLQGFREAEEFLKQHRV